MQLEWFRYFLETASTKSLSKASEQLNMTQPALSKIIRNLERELGVTLFHRSAAGMELTHAGVQLQRRIEPILAEIHVLMNDLLLLNGTAQIKIGVLPSIATYYLPSRMAMVQASFPDAQLMVGNTSDEVLQWLMTGRVQAVIAECREAHRHVWRSRLFEEPYFCVLPESSSLGKANSVRVAQIANEPLVLYPSNCDIRTSIAESYAKHGYTPVVSLEIPFSESILAFVRSGAGVSIAPKSIAEQSDRYGLKAVRIDDFERTREIYVVSRDEAVGKLLHRQLLKVEKAATRLPARAAQT